MILYFQIQKWEEEKGTIWLHGYPFQYQLVWPEQQVTIPTVFVQKEFTDADCGDARIVMTNADIFMEDNDLAECILNVNRSSLNTIP